MSWLLAIGLKNAILALPLAAMALAASRWSRRPALAHVLWAIVLVKLLTPPLIDVPVGWKLDVEGWLAQTPESGPLAPRVESIEPKAAGARRVAADRSASASPPSARHASRPGRVGPAAGRSGADRPHARQGGPASASGGLVPPSSASWPVVAGLVWIAGSMGLLGLFLLRAMRFRRYLRWATGRDEFLGPRVAELAYSVGLTIPPKVIVVDGIVSPMLWGLGQRACLVFPAKLAQRLSPQKLDSLLLHELAHYSRGDHWIRALELAAFVLFWWHPVVWWARREIEAAEEECCDAWVVQHLRGTRLSYAEALLTTIDFLCERPGLLPPVACGLGEVQLLRVRLTQIMRGQVAAGLPYTLRVAVVVVGLVISPLEPALWATSSPPLPTRSRPMRAVSPANRQPSVAASTSSSKSSAMSRRSAAPSLPATSVSAASAGAQRAALIPAAPPRPAISLWATAVAPNGRFQLEARRGGRTTLVGAQGGFRLDLSAHQILCASFAPDSGTFVTGHADALVRLWDSETGGLESSLHGSQSAITSVHISPDGARVAAGAKDGSVLVWELASGDVLAQLPRQGAAVSCLRWSPRGDRLAIALGDFFDHAGSSLLIWTPQENVVVAEHSLDKPAGALDWLGNEALIVADWSGQAILWNVRSGKPTGTWQVDKDLVSAAQWSGDCPLVTRYLADQFLTGAQP